MNENDMPPRRRLLSRGNIWLRVTAFTALLLVGVFLSTMALAAVGIGESSSSSGGHGSGQPTEMSPEGPGGSHESGGDHESGGGTTSDHDPPDEPVSGDHGSGD